MTALLITILICIALILLGSTTGKPIGWVVLGLAVMAMLLAMFGSIGVRVGH